MRATVFLLLAACDPARATTSTTLQVGAKPIEVTAGDLDGDRRLDLVAVNTDGTISVRLHRDRGWVAAPGDPLKARAHLAGLGDLDGDGKLDLATTDHDSGDVSVFLGDGTGRFRAAQTVRAITAAKPHNHGLIVRDLDGDRDADVIVADQTAKQVAVLLADKGTLAVAATIALPDQAYPPAAGDLDRDGDLDIVVPLVGGRAVAVLLGDGKGGFGPARTYATSRVRPYGVAIGDLDGNGTADVLVAHDDTDFVAVLSGDGRGALAETRSLELPTRIGTPILVDLDGDGALDLVGAGGGKVIIVDRKLSRIRSEPGGGWRVFAGDLDGNGTPDLVSPDPDGDTVRIWRY
jgi:hypothetical protein